MPVKARFLAVSKTTLVLRVWEESPSFGQPMHCGPQALIFDLLFS